MYLLLCGLPPDITYERIQELLGAWCHGAQATLFQLRASPLFGPMMVDIEVTTTEEADLIKSGLDGSSLDGVSKLSVLNGNSSEILYEIMHGLRMNPRTGTFVTPPVKNVETMNPAIAESTNPAGFPLSRRMSDFPRSGADDYLCTNRLSSLGLSTDFMSSRIIMVDEEAERRRARLARFDGRLEFQAGDMQISTDFARKETPREHLRMRTPPPPELGRIKLCDEQNFDNVSKYRGRSRSPPRRRRSLEHDRNRRDKPSSLRGDSHKSDEKSRKSSRVNVRRSSSREADRGRAYHESRYKGRSSSDKDRNRHAKNRRSSFSPDGLPDYDINNRRVEGPRGDKRKRSQETDRYKDAREFKKRFDRENLERSRTERELEQRCSDKLNSDGSFRRSKSVEIKGVCRSKLKENTKDKASDKWKTLPRENLRSISPKQLRGEHSLNVKATDGSNNIPIQQGVLNASVTAPEQLISYGNFPNQPNQQGPLPINPPIPQLPISTHGMNHTVNQQVIMTSYNTSSEKEIMDPKIQLEINAFRSEHLNTLSYVHAQIQSLHTPATKSNIDANPRLQSNQSIPYQIRKAFNHENYQYGKKQPLLATPNLQNTPLQINQTFNNELCVATKTLIPTSYMPNNLDATQKLSQSRSITNHLQTNATKFTADCLEGLLNTSEKIQELRVVSQHIFLKLCDEYNNVNEIFSSEAENFEDLFVEAILNRILTFQDLETSLSSQILIKYNVLYNTDDKNKMFIAKTLKKYAEMKERTEFGSPISVEKKAEELCKSDEPQTSYLASSIGSAMSTSAPSTITSESNRSSAKRNNTVTAIPSRQNSEGLQKTERALVPPNFASARTTLMTPNVTPVPGVKQVPPESDMTPVVPLPMKQAKQALTQPITQVAQSSKVTVVPLQALMPVPEPIRQAIQSSKVAAVPTRAIMPVLQQIRQAMQTLKVAAVPSRAEMPIPPAIIPVVQSSRVTTIPPRAIMPVSQPIRQASQFSKIPPRAINPVSQPKKQVAKSSQELPRTLIPVPQTFEVTPVAAKLIGQLHKPREGMAANVPKLSRQSLQNPEPNSSNQEANKTTGVSIVARNVAVYKTAIRLVNIVLRNTHPRNSNPFDDIVHSKILQLADNMHSTFQRIINSSFEANNYARKKLPVVSIRLPEVFYNYGGLHNFLDKYKALNGAYIKRRQRDFFYYATLPNEHLCEEMLRAGPQLYIGDQRVTLSRVNSTWQYRGPKTSVIAPYEGPLMIPTKLPTQGTSCGAKKIGCDEDANDKDEMTFIDSQITKLDDY